MMSLPVIETAITNRNQIFCAQESSETFSGTFSES